MKAEVARQVALAVRETDDTFILGARQASQQNWRDRYDYDREKILLDALLVWRSNPLARRIVELTSQYVVGGGLVPSCKHIPTAAFLTKFWNHRLNHMETRCIEWCDELTRSGELFILISTDPGGQSYARAVAAADIQAITPSPNDIEQAVSFQPKASADNLDPAPYIAYDEQTDAPDTEGKWQPRMIQYAVNRPVGGQHGESDMGPLLRWLTRYDGWLEDRVRLNRYRQAFMYILTGTWENETERLKEQAAYNAAPPPPASILLTDKSKTWGVLNPQLASFEAGEDGLAIKKHIAVGSGNPLHFLAEPEGETRTTAAASGSPTFRHYEQRQLYFLSFVKDILNIVRRRADKAGRRLSVTADIAMRGGDISGRDNAALALAASQIVASFAVIRDRGLIDDAELLRLSYRFAGELVDVEEMLERGKAAPLPRILPRDGAAPAAPQDNKKKVKPGDPNVDADVEPKDDAALAVWPPSAAMPSNGEEHHA
jgi:hypothetical protein